MMWLFRSLLILGSIADDIIDVLREAGVTPAQEPAQAPKSN